MNMRDRARDMRALRAALPMLRDQAAVLTDDEMVAQMAALYPAWSVEVVNKAKKGAIYSYNGQLYRLLKTNPQGGKTPDEDIKNYSLVQAAAS